VSPSAPIKSAITCELLTLRTANEQPANTRENHELKFSQREGEIYTVVLFLFYQSLNFRFKRVLFFSNAMA
jgi:hypothetical protein